MKMFFKMKPLVVAVSTCTLLIACGGNNVKSNTPELTGEGTNPTKPITPTEEEPVKALGKYSLQKATNNKEFLNYYKDSIQKSTEKNYNIITVDGLETVVDVPTADVPNNKDTANPDNKNKGFSTTNLIEEGVDELDFVKQNADNIYTTRTENNNNSILVYNKPNTKSVASIALPASASFKGLFLNDKSLYSLRQVTRPYQYKHYDDGMVSVATAENKGTPDLPKNTNATLSLDVLNVSDSKKPAITKSYTWDGEYVNSRRIGDNVYVISNTHLVDYGYCNYPAGKGFMSDVEIYRPYCDDADKLTTESLVDKMPVDISGNKVKPADCYIPSQHSKNSDFLNENITLVTKIDLSGNEKHQTTCIASSSQHIYMSPNGLYLASDDYVITKNKYEPRTIINKFNIDAGNLVYAGAGSVKGVIQWNNATFSMNEHNGVLRIATVNRDTGFEPKNMIHTLRESDNEIGLEKLATIPNEQQPKKIGKPNEEMKGIRFFGDQGYVVTFQKTDPLYKIDFTDPSSPKVLGELEMPGYSAYLQRINDKYLLGIGYEMRENRQVGLQTTVFDITQDNPTIVDQDTQTIIPSDSYDVYFHLPLNRDSRSITTLTDTNKMRVAIPYKVNSGSYNTSHVYGFKVKEYSIDLATGKLVEKLTRDIIPEVTLNQAQVNQGYSNFVNGFNSNRERGLMDGDDIYYNLFDGSLAKHLWSVQ